MAVSMGPPKVRAVSALLVGLVALAAGGGRHVSHAEEDPEQQCCTPAELAAFVAKQAAGSRRLCPTTDMQSDLGTLKVEAAQRISVVGSGSPSAAQPRFFGRFVLDDGSGADVRLQRVTVRDRNASLLPGCLGSSAGVHCLGAAAWVGEPATLAATDSTFSGLSSSDGGAIYVRGGTVLLERVVFVNAHADFSGGAIFAALMPAPVTVRDSFFESNSAGRLGGAILAWNSSSFTVCNSSFVSNTAPGVDGDPGGPAIVRCAPGCTNETFLPTGNGDGVDIACGPDAPARAAYSSRQRVVV